ncbi:uncharacterized protein LOC124285655 [Haliotis rubra]|uniref:uncharacterized protein LOC124285655 n=1 Tax=Haliotis rubra TaxID=36100 RepID=UPI001EE52F25|nr:uncharacterized protein LOC124285655 [Haliotis rubra]
MGFFQVSLVCLIVCSGIQASPIKQSVLPALDDDANNGGNVMVSNLLKTFENIPILKSMVEKSGLDFTELQHLLGEQNLIGQLVQNVFKLCPICGQIIDDAAKTNVELRIVLALAKGQTPNLFDLFKLATMKSENMFNAVDNAATANKQAQLIKDKMKEPHPNITNIWNMITGKKLDTGDILDTDKYAVAGSSKRKNRHLLELFEFFVANWRPLEKAFRTMSNFPINFVKVMQYFLGLDFSSFRFAMDNAPKLNNKKYMITDNKAKHSDVNESTSSFDSDDDADIIHVLQEVRVKYPSMHDTFASPNGNAEARDAVLHLITEGIEVMNRLLG